MVTVVPYIGTWIETAIHYLSLYLYLVVPYIGTWIETLDEFRQAWQQTSYLI